MVTNDEINKRKLKIAKYLKENFLVCGFDTAAILELLDEIEDLARHNTSNQIFAELDDILKRGSEVYDSVEHIVYHKLTIEDEREYQEIKKEYNVE